MAQYLTENKWYLLLMNGSSSYDIGNGANQEQRAEKEVQVPTRTSCQIFCRASQLSTLLPKSPLPLLKPCPSPHLRSYALCSQVASAPTRHYSLVTSHTLHLSHHPQASYPLVIISLHSSLLGISILILRLY